MNTAKSPTRLRDKLGLFLVGIILAPILLELGLRLGGFIFLSLQERKNQASLNQGELRVLCLGESTSALGGDDAYPRQLERILNAKQSRIKFTVINKGIPATNTTQIVTRLGRNLTTYKPQIVVTMMGINDPPGQLFSEKSFSQNPVIHFLQNFRIYKLAKLLRAHLQQKSKERELALLNQKLTAIELQLSQNPNPTGYNQLAAFYRAKRDWDKEQQTLMKALALDPRNFSALCSLGLSYTRFGDYANAIPAYATALSLAQPGTPNWTQTYVMLAESFKFNGQFNEAEKIYQRAIADIPGQDTRAYGGLGEIYLEQGKVEEAKGLFEKQLAQNSSANIYYRHLAHCYHILGQHDRAETLLQQAVRLNPRAADLYNELGATLIENKKYSVAEEVLKKSLTLEKDEIEGDSKSIYINLAKTYVAQGKKVEAQKIQQFLDHTLADYSGETYQNYESIRKTLSSQGIKMVVVQYPMRRLAPLKKMLEPANDLIFVDNEKIFKDAVAKKSYDEFFTDRFAGDFGHCTATGNRLLAENVAQAILNITQR